MTIPLPRRRVGTPLCQNAKRLTHCFRTGLLLSGLVALASCSGKTAVELQRFPYPYQAAVAICSDIDETTAEEFIAIQRFLCSTDTTALGPGLGLEIGNSFWMFNQYLGMLADSRIDPDSAAAAFIGYPDSGLSWFAGVSSFRSPPADLIMEMAQAGYLDCLHSYGHFNESGFGRQEAELAYAALRTAHIRPLVFVNHNAPQNAHNLGPGPVDAGDDPGAYPYHADLTIDQLGVRFLWKGRLTHCVGQSGNVSFWNVAKSFWEWGKHLLYPSARGWPLGNELVNPLTLDDGRRVFEFTRFISPWGRASEADAASLAHQLAPKILDELVSNHGSMIVYTHLGRNAGPPYFPEATVHALRGLKRRYDAGEILVTTTSRLLRYHVNRRSLFWHATESNDTVSIVLDSLMNDVEGPRIPTDEELAGITFSVPSGREVRVFVGENELSIESGQAVQEGRHFVQIPWRPLRWASEWSSLVTPPRSPHP